MSIKDEIDRIKMHIAEAYTALSDLGATMPASRNSEHLAETVRSVSAGGMQNAITVANNTNDLLICGATRMHPGEQATMLLPEDGADFIAFTLCQSPTTSGIKISIVGTCYDWNEDASRDIDTEEELFADGNGYINPTFVWNDPGIFLQSGTAIEVNLG